jgi:hypothetical protein
VDVAPLATNRSVGWGADLPSAPLAHPMAVDSDGGAGCVGGTTNNGQEATGGAGCVGGTAGVGGAGCIGGSADDGGAAGSI